MFDKNKFVLLVLGSLLIVGSTFTKVANKQHKEIIWSVAAGAAGGAIGVLVLRDLLPHLLQGKKPTASSGKQSQKPQHGWVSDQTKAQYHAACAADEAKHFFEHVVKAIRYEGRALTEDAQYYGDKAVKEVKGAAQKVSQKGKDYAAQAEKSAKKGIHKVEEKGDEYASKATDTVKKGVHKVEEKGKEYAAQATDAVKKGGQAVKEGVKHTYEDAKHSTKKAVDDTKRVVKKGVHKAEGMASRAERTAQSTLSSAKEEVGEMAGQLKEAIVVAPEKVKNLLHKAAHFTQEEVETLRTKAQRLRNKKRHRLTANEKEHLIMWHIIAAYEHMHNVVAFHEKYEATQKRSYAYDAETQAEQARLHLQAIETLLNTRTLRTSVK